jgi:hypothetical protein
VHSGYIVEVRCVARLYVERSVMGFLKGVHPVVVWSHVFQVQVWI